MRIRAVFQAIFVLVFSVFASVALAAPYAAMVMDARTGEVLHSRNADTRLHPASLTKMMTLYLTFKAVENGQLKLDQKIRISENAAAEPPSRLGLTKGSKITVRYLIRAAGIKSANDAATALGEAIAGSEAGFAKLMTAQAKALGMSKTTFKNAHGLTQSGHMSTARDMTILGRRIMYDFPEYYNIFSRRSAHAGLREVANTNRRLLANYRGADGIKTGYTNAAGFNLVASAERGNKRIIATVFGGRTSATRNARVAELLDMGFSRTPQRYASDAAPATPQPGVRLAAIGGKSNPALIIRAPRAVAQSPRPKWRPKFSEDMIAAASVVREDIEAEILLAAQISAEERLRQQNIAQTDLYAQETAILNSVVLASNARPTYVEPPKQERRVVSSAAVTKGGGWSIQLGAYSTRFNAEKALLRTALADVNALEGADKVVQPTKGDEGKQLYRARFVGLSQVGAERTCARLRARGEDCTAIRPGAS
ncbi:MAG: D-alanyl-D-alanine carboxypeptidase family protein [Pseudomonadota bacterium]